MLRDQHREMLQTSEYYLCSSLLENMTSDQMLDLTI